MTSRGTSFTSTRELLQSAASGRKSAQRRLIERFEPLLRSLVWRHLGPARFRSEGEDALQAMRLAVLRSLATVRARDLPAFVAWLRKLVRSRLIDLDRAGRPRGGGPSPVIVDIDGTGAPQLAAETPTPSRIVMDREERAHLMGGIERVPERYRAILRLIVEEEPTPAEVAMSLGKSVEASRKFVARALEHLRRALRAGESTRILR